MTWLDFLPRAWSRNKRAPACARGLDYLRAQAGLPEPEKLHAPVTEPVTREECCDRAEQAHKLGDWPEAERRWAAMRAAFPDIWFGYLGGAAALCGLRRSDDARQLLCDAALRFPQEPGIRYELGHLAARQADWPAAEGHWRVALTLGDQPWWIYTELSRAVEQQGRIVEAEAVLLDGQFKDPGEISLFTNHARLAWVREDWSAAVDRWTAAQRRFPITEELSSGLYQALMRLSEHDPAAADAAHQELELTATADDMRSLLLRFESLGGSGPDGGCEFGGVQRERGAEPLGLLRWATVTPPSLIAALEARFAGIGEADNTTVYLQEDDPAALWQIGDKRYGTAMHSFVPSKEVPHDRMVVLARKRMRYLRDKLIADLENPVKVFVLKVADRDLTVSEIEALSRGIRSYGPGELLCVCPANVRHPAGEIVSEAPGVFIGRIDFSGRLDVVQRHSSWETLCAETQRMSAMPRRGWAACG